MSPYDGCLSGYPYFVGAQEKYSSDNLVVVYLLSRINDLLQTPYDIAVIL